MGWCSETRHTGAEVQNLEQVQAQSPSLCRLATEMAVVGVPSLLLRVCST